MNYIAMLYQLFCLKKNEKKTRLEILKLQKSKLHKILKYAYDNSPYYHRKFQEAGIDGNNIAKITLSDLPVIHKEQFMEYFDEIVTSPNIKQRGMVEFDENLQNRNTTYQGRYHIVHSSGSTGKPRYFVYDNKAWEQMLLGIIRGALWGMNMKQIVKLLIKKPRILYIAATDGRYGGAMAVGDGISGVGAKQRFLDINTPLSEWSKCITDYQPNLIIGYPSAIKILGDLIEKENISLCVSRIISCGEPLDRGLRAHLSRIFQAEVINFYGASESLAIGVEGDKSDGMILFDDLNIIEVVDGEMYLTCLYNFVQPLIRYHISDQLIIHPESEVNEYAFTKADVLKCRSEEILWFQNEQGKREFLHPLSVEGLCVPGLIDYQFRQLSDSSFEMLAEVEKGSDNQVLICKVEELMEHILSENNLEFVSFKVRVVEHILPDEKTGKKPLILRSKIEMQKPEGR